MGALGAGLVGSLLLYVVYLLLGRSEDAAYSASFYGFWVFALGSLFFGRATRSEWARRAYVPSF